MYKKLLVTTGITLACIGLPNISCSMEYKDEKLDPIRVRQMFENPDYTKIIDSVTKQDIVVFLGKTHSGKSTLVNFLADKDLQFNDIGKIELVNPNDESAMKIGGGQDSVTSLPKSIPYNKLYFYDLPGFCDNRGPNQSIENAYFIKNIIENANSCKLLFVTPNASYNRGSDDNAIDVLKVIDKFIPDQNVQDFSGLIITIHSHIIKDYKKFINSKTNNNIPIVNYWTEKNRISSTDDREIMPIEKNRILELINTMESKKVKNVNVECVYGKNEKNSMKTIYEEEFKKIFDSLGYENLSSIKQKEEDSLNTEKLKRKSMILLLIKQKYQLGKLISMNY